LSPHLKNKLKELTIKSKLNSPLQPFLKWAGGKRQLLEVLKQFVPVNYTDYYEPFIGAGALLFFLQPKRAVINDINGELVNTYRILRDYPEELFNLCEDHRKNNSKNYYYSIRNIDREIDFNYKSPLERAARIIYLNKTCFNGLYRVNRLGHFNVPYGSYVNPTILNFELLLGVSNYLRRCQLTILEGDYTQAVKNAAEGAFIYFDPPYQPLSNTSSFTSYSVAGFGEREQRRLKSVCDELDARGCQILLSNSDTPFIRELYKDSRYEIAKVQAIRTINVVSSKRGKISELLIHNRYDQLNRRDLADKL
jgi:DNA adenine methylase